MTLAEMSRLIAWFVKQARPGHASLAADIVSVAHCWQYESDDDLSMWRAVHPLAEWLLLNGSAELRSSRRHELSLQIVHAVHLFGAGLEELVPAIRYVLLNEQPLGGYFDDARDSRTRLLDAVEHALGAGAPDSLAPDVVLAWSADTSPSVLNQLLDPPAGVGTYSLVRGALIRALVRGQLVGAHGVWGWRGAFWSPFPEAPLKLMTLEALERALSALKEQALHSARHRGVEVRCPVEVIRPWAHFIASEAIRILGLQNAIKSGNPNQARLDRCVGYHDGDGVTWGIRDAVYSAIANAKEPARVALARAILEEAPEDPFMIVVAFSTIPVEPKLEVAAARGRLLERLHHDLFNLINQPWLEPAFGISLPQMIGHATRIELVDLPDESSVEVASGMIRVDRRSLAMAVDLPWTEEERLAHGSLYFMHEVIHRFQGIHRKAMVDPLHAAGAESTLLHIDLGADHAAARLVSLAVPRWSLSWLKDLQGRSLVNFPAGRFHTAAARARKAQRLVGLRLGFLSRTSGSPCDVGLD